MSVPDRTAPRGSAWLLGLWGVSLTVWWGFGFFPTTPGDESWIAVAQYACFGSRPGGPPEIQGWMMLVLAPLMLLATLLVVQGAELRRVLPALVRSRTVWAVTLVLAAAFAVEVSWAAARLGRDARAQSASFEPTITEPLPAEFPRSAIPLPAFRLVDQTGAACEAASLTGQPTVLSFVFAHCQTVCPVLVSSVTRAARELGPGTVRIALVTLDPWRDTPAELPALAARWALPDGSRLLSGEPSDVCRLLDTLQVARERDLKNGDVSHVPLVMIVDGQGRIVYRFSNPPADWIVEGVRRIRGRS